MIGLPLLRGYPTGETYGDIADRLAAETSGEEVPARQYGATELEAHHVQECCTQSDTDSVLLSRGGLDKVVPRHRSEQRPLRGEPIAQVTGEGDGAGHGVLATLLAVEDRSTEITERGSEGVPEGYRGEPAA